MNLKNLLIFMLLFSIGMLLNCTFTACYEGECDVGDPESCDGDTLIYCGRLDRWEKYQCDYYDDGMCMEFTEDENNYNRAACVLSLTPCPEGRSAVCVGNRIGNCVHGYPECVFTGEPCEECSSSSECIEYDAGGAECWPPNN